MHPINAAQKMWIDAISAILQQTTFDMAIGDMSYVFKNMIAKYVSSADFYRISNGALEEIVFRDPALKELIDSGESVDMKRYFYGKDKQTLLEHTVPTSVTANCLLALGQSPDKRDVEFVLLNAGEVAIVLRGEDKLLSKSRMPAGWKVGDSIYARYDNAGIELSTSTYIRRGARIYR